MIRAAIAAALAAVLFLTPASGVKAAADDNAYKQLNLFGDVFELVRAKYVTDVDSQKLIYAAISGMLTALDPHSAFMDSDSYKSMQEQTSGQFGGLGIEVRMEDLGVRVVRPMDDTPASKAGIKANDMITALDGVSLKGTPLNEAVDKMRGKIGSPIKLTVVRDGVEKPFDVTVNRDVIRQASVTSRPEGTTGYIKITSFTEQTSTGLNKAMTDLKTALGDKLEGYILDLRDNPGGLLDQSVAVVETFLGQGTVVLTRGRDPNNVSRYAARKNDQSAGKPLVVLINGGSASASEIVAGALQDHKRGIIMGTQSFGKGSVQTIIPLGEYGAMRLTTSRYYTPSGRSIQGTGITPDILVEQGRLEPLKAPAAQVANPTPRAAAGAAAATPAPAAATPPPAPTDYQLARAVDMIHALATYQKVATN